MGNVCDVSLCQNSMCFSFFLFPVLWEDILAGDGAPVLTLGMELTLMMEKQSRKCTFFIWGGFYSGFCSGTTPGGVQGTILGAADHTSVGHMQGEVLTCHSTSSVLYFLISTF